MGTVHLVDSDLRAIVDDCDYESVCALAWHIQAADQTTENFYCYTTINGRKAYLHRFLLNAPRGRTVDPENGDGLDNRRANIRIATQGQNNANRASSNPTGFRGVYIENGRPRAKISDRANASKCRHLGYFKTIEEAARAYDRAAVERFGEFARLNFPGESEAA